MNPRRHLVGTCLVAAALAVAAVGCSSTHRASSRPTTSAGTVPRAGTVTYGIDVNYYDKDIGPARVPQVLSLIHKAGAGAVRIGVDWAQVEPSPGAYRWAAVDRLFSLARADGLQVLFELGNEPAWDAVGADPAAPPSDCAAATATCASVASYVTALVGHAARLGLRELILRNEPQDFAKNWVGGSAAAYARFEQVAYQAAHRADPAVEVLNGGTEVLPASLRALGAAHGLTSAYTDEEEAFVHALYADPAWCDSIDVLDVHVGDHGPVWSPQIVDDSEATATACRGGKPPLPVWVTEVGYPSIPSLQASAVYDVELHGAYRGGPAGQARFLTDTFKALAADPNVIGIDWTFLVDPNLTDTLPAGTSYQQAFGAGAGDGLLTAAYQPKASYQAYQNLASPSPGGG